MKRNLSKVLVIISMLVTLPALAEEPKDKCQELKRKEFNIKKEKKFTIYSIEATEGELPGGYEVSIVFSNKGILKLGLRRPSNTDPQTKPSMDPSELAFCETKFQGKALHITIPPAKAPYFWTEISLFDISNSVLYDLLKCKTDWTFTTAGKDFKVTESRRLVLTQLANWANCEISKEMKQKPDSTQEADPNKIHTIQPSAPSEGDKDE